MKYRPPFSWRRYTGYDCDSYAVCFADHYLLMTTLNYYYLRESAVFFTLSLGRL